MLIRRSAPVRIGARSQTSEQATNTWRGAALIEMRRLLKPTGSIYLHCDPTMSHYLKVLMDAVFGRCSFVTPCAMT